jgi:hypothetical protein
VPNADWLPCMPARGEESWHCLPVAGVPAMLGIEPGQAAPARGDRRWGNPAWEPAIPARKIRSRPSRRTKSRPSRGNLTRPRLGSKSGPAGLAGRRPGRNGRRPRRRSLPGERSRPGGEAQPGSGSRPGHRGRGDAAHAGGDAWQRPSRDKEPASPARVCCAGPGGHMPAWVSYSGPATL